MTEGSKVPDSAVQAHRPLTDPQIERVVTRYSRERARFEAACQYVANTISRAAWREAVNHLQSFRAKDGEKLREKLGRKRDDPRYRYEELLEDVGGVVTDLAGVRLVVYAEEHEARLTDIAKSAVPLAKRNDCSAVHEKDSGYRATHLLVQVPKDAPVAIRGTICEVQICAVAAHLFNELEHDITYKQDGQVSNAEKAALKKLRKATKKADELAARLVAAHSARINAQSVPVADAEELRFVLESSAQRVLRGDFVGLFRLLNALVDPLSRVAIAQFGSVGDVIDRGSKAVSGLGVVDAGTDDVVFYCCGLEDMVQEMSALAAGWNHDSPLKTALTSLAKGADG